MIVVVASLEFASLEQRDAAVAATVDLQRATREEEPGCRAYCFAADPVVDDRVQVYELWDDEATLAAHFEHPNYHGVRTRLGECGLVSSTSRKLRVDRDEPVYDENRVPQAAFST